MPAWLAVAAAFLVGVVVGWKLRSRSDGPQVTIIPARSPSELDAQVHDLLAQGKKLQAIRLYREFHHVDLKDAKTIIEVMDQNRALPPR